MGTFNMTVEELLAGVYPCSSDVSKSKIIYTPHELLALEGNAVLPDDAELPEREFYRINIHPSDLMKMANYLHNLKNPNFRAKHKLGALAKGHRYNKYSEPGDNRHNQNNDNVDDEDEDPEWMEETNFKVDQDFQQYMKSGSHTTVDFEQERLTFQAMYTKKFGKKNIQSNGEGLNEQQAKNESVDAASSSDAPPTKRTDTEIDIPSTVLNESELNQSTSHVEHSTNLEDELRRQLEEPEILGPTEEEYFKALEEQKKLELNQLKGKAQETEFEKNKSRVTSSDYQFAVELDSRKELDNSFMNSLLQRSDNNESNDGHPSNISSEQNEREPLARSGSHILPSQKDPSITATANMPICMVSLDMPRNMGVTAQHSQNPIDIQNLEQLQNVQQLQQMQQARQLQLNQMQRMQQAQQMQQLQQMQHLQAQRQQQMQGSQMLPQQLHQQQQQQQQQQHPASNDMKMNIPPALAALLPPGVQLNSIPPHVLQQLIARANSAGDMNSNVSRSTSSDGSIQQNQAPGQPHNQRPIIHGNAPLPAFNMLGMPPGLPHGAPPAFMQGQSQMMPPAMQSQQQQMMQQLPPGMFPQSMNNVGMNHPDPNMMTPQQRNMMGQGLQMNPMLNGMPPSFPPGMAQQGIIPPGMLPGNLPPPDQLPSPFKEKFLNIQRMLLHFQQNGQNPPPALVQDMIQFQQILQAKFGNNRNNVGAAEAAISSTTATIATNCPRM